MSSDYITYTLNFNFSLEGDQEMQKFTAIYLRVSSKQQKTDSQERDVNQWIQSHPEEQTELFIDHYTGKSMNRPGWNRLWDKVLAGKVNQIVVWRIDRLGRTVTGLAQLFEHCLTHDINLISLRDGIDLSTPAGRLIAHVMASVAMYETECRGERTRAGMDRVRKPHCPKCGESVKPTKRDGNTLFYRCEQCQVSWTGRTWGGRKKGQRYKVTDGTMAKIKKLLEKGVSVTDVAKSVGLNRSYIYRIMSK